MALPISFFFSDYVPHRDLHSFPTRRSSDLVMSQWKRKRGNVRSSTRSARIRRRNPVADSSPARTSRERETPSTAETRSEEHTSELQSRPHLVCRLLLEKKKQTNTQLVTYKR